MAIPAKPKFEELIDDILQESTVEFPSTADGQWNHYLKLRALIEAVKAKEKARDGEGANDPTDSKRCKKLPAFLTWLRGKGVKLPNVEIRETNNDGDTEDFGVFLTSNTKEGDLLFEIPLNIAIDVPNAVRDGLASLLNTGDPLVCGMENVQVAIFVLNEKYKEKPSEWKPYLDFLPTKFNTVYFFTESEMNLLFKSHANAFKEGLKMYRNIARQYAYLHKAFKLNRDPVSRNMNKIFTYTRYAWAVSLVTTRINSVNQTFAIIPMYDLINHDQSSDTRMEVEENVLQVKSSKPLSASTEYKMNYGLRTHVDFLIHNGFASDQKSLLYVLDLGISPSDPKYKDKVNRLQGMKKQSFECRLGKLQESTALTDFLKVFLDTENIQEIWKFLNVRFALLSKGTGANLKTLLKNSDNHRPEFIANLVRLLRCEELLLSELSIEAKTLADNQNGIAT